MKNIIITGTAKPSPNNMVYYNLDLFGQTKENPRCTFITSLNIECNGHTEMEEICRNKYAKYFDTDLFNIISLNSINILPSNSIN